MVEQDINAVAQLIPVTNAGHRDFEYKQTLQGLLSGFTARIGCNLTATRETERAAGQFPGCGRNFALDRSRMTEYLVPMNCTKAMYRDADTRCMVMTAPMLKSGLALLTGAVIEDRALGASFSEITAVTAATLALAGVPVHVISTDSDQAESEMCRVSRLYLALGITVGLVTRADGLGR